MLSVSGYPSGCRSLSGRMSSSISREVDGDLKFFRMCDHTIISGEMCRGIVLLDPLENCFPSEDNEDQVAHESNVGQCA